MPKTSSQLPHGLAGGRGPCVVLSKAFGAAIHVLGIICIGWYELWIGTRIGAVAVYRKFTELFTAVIICITFMRFCASTSAKNTR